VVSTLVLVVTEKQASIAILRTLGASSRDIQKIFMTLGLAIGAGGLALGLLLGLGIVSVVEPLVRGLETLTGFQFLYSDVYPLTHIPAEVQVGDLVSVSVVAAVLIFLATLLPARQAAKLQPADILRYE
jgi:lipoprotein-releasing system permease protein